MPAAARGPARENPTPPANREKPVRSYKEGWRGCTRRAHGTGNACIRSRSRNAGRTRNSPSRLRFLFADIFHLACAQLRWFPFVYVGYGTRKARSTPESRRNRALIALVVGAEVSR